MIGHGWFVYVQPSEKDAGDYVCVIKNDAGELSKKISVTKSKMSLSYITMRGCLTDVSVSECVGSRVQSVGYQNLTAG